MNVYKITGTLMNRWQDVFVPAKTIRESADLFCQDFEYRIVLLYPHWFHALSFDGVAQTFYIQQVT